jgi:hypothetical protein
MIEMQTNIVKVNRMGKLYNNRRVLQMPPASGCTKKLLGREEKSEPTC